MTSVTFVVDRRKHLNGRDQFAVLRIREHRMDVISHHETTDQAMEEAHRYASQARFSGLHTRVVQRD